MAAANFCSLASRRPTVVNLHVAPGLGNAIGMMYGALKANSPVVVTAGQQDTRMRMREPLLSHDLVAMAAPVTKWSAEPRTADEVGPMMARAFQIAMEPPAGPVFIALPVDVMSNETQIAAYANTSLHTHPPAADTEVMKLAELLQRAQAPAIVAGDDVTAYGGNEALRQIAEKTGAAVFQEGLRAYNNFPNQHAQYRGRIPFEASNIRRVLSNFDLILMIGGPFFRRDLV